MQRLLDHAVACGLVLILVGAFAVSLGFFGSPVGRAYFDDEVRGKFAQPGQKAAPHDDLARVFGGPPAQKVETYKGGTQLVAEQGAGETQAAAPLSVRSASTRVSYVYAGRKLATVSGGAISFAHGDHLGTGAARTDQGASVVESSRQLPFGTQLGVISRETDFTGKKADGRTGLNYFGARHYLSAVGSFATSEPLFDARDALYAYVGNRPLTMVDPTGMIVESVETTVPEWIDNALDEAWRAATRNPGKGAVLLSGLKKYGTPLGTFLSILFGASPLNEGEDEQVRERNRQYLLGFVASPVDANLEDRLALETDPGRRSILETMLAEREELKANGWLDRGGEFQEAIRSGNSQVFLGRHAVKQLHREGAERLRPEDMKRALQSEPRWDPVGKSLYYFDPQSGLALYMNPLGSERGGLIRTVENRGHRNMGPEGLYKPHNRIVEVPQDIRDSGGIPKFDFRD